MRKLTKRQARIVGELIADWRRAGMVSAAEAARLSAGYQVSSFDWKRLAAVSLVAPVLCLMTAIVAIPGVALWFLGSRARKIWNLGRRKRPAESA